MAKKISKHSRAARRNEIDEPEARDLAQLPRAEKTDTTSAIIRATAKKNEDLLTSKLEKKEASKNRITKKKSNTQLSNIDKEKLERAMALTDKLDNKINKSKERARQVQTARKSNWDTINTQIKRELTAEEKKTLEEQEAEKEEKDGANSEDEMVDDFYSEENTQKPKKTVNAFSLLDEVEA